MAASDAALRTVFKEQIEKLKIKRLVDDVDPEAISGLDQIPDIYLCRKYPIDRDSVMNVVIELKRPMHKLDVEDLDQVDNYAFTVSKVARFDPDRTKWSFILVGSELSPKLQNRVRTKNLPRGVAFQGERYDILVKAWNEIIRDNQVRLEFLQNSLEFAVQDDSAGMAYLAKKYAELLPQVVGAKTA